MVPHAGILLGGGLVLLRLGAAPGGVGRIGDDGVEGSGGEAPQQLQGIALDNFPTKVSVHRRFPLSLIEIFEVKYGKQVNH